MNNLNSPELIEAVRIWTGWGQSLTPKRDDDRVVNHFGNVVAAKLLPLIKSLEEDFYSSDARLVAADIEEMEQLASQQFKLKHPSIAGEIVKVFAWCYTFDWK
ncbi:MAG: hypothetical protein MUE94_02140 [Verrucomicrobia bacterium]|jgi:hypothetical protein|nr:hypothetical protein [Verrucomicrobiota bacterium]